MSDASATEAYNALLLWLRSNNLEWVATQIEEEIILGKIKSERIHIPADLASPYSSKTSVEKSTRSEFLARVDYTAQEKFEIAVGAVEAVVLGGIKIQDALASTLITEHADIQIHFVPGETGETAHMYQPIELADPKSRIEEIEHYLRELRIDVKK